MFPEHQGSDNNRLVASEAAHLWNGKWHPPAQKSMKKMLRANLTVNLTCLRSWVSRLWRWDSCLPNVWDISVLACWDSSFSCWILVRTPERALSICSSALVSSTVSDFPWLVTDCAILSIVANSQTNLLRSPAEHLEEILDNNFSPFTIP